MRILLSNDDGTFAPGLAALADGLKDLAELTVVAPDRDCSGSSHSLTLSSPLRVQSLDNGFMSVNGTPTDCVHLAITGLISEPLDMVVSGINSGANLGDDVLYSGTVAAAVEGRFLGFPALAVSMAAEGEGVLHYDTGARVACKLVQQVVDHPLEPGVVLNVNVPNVPFEDLQGFTVTRLGERHRSEPVVPAEDQRGRRIYWVGPAGPEQDAGPGTDFYAIAQNQVSITPLRIDLTDHGAIEPLSAWVSRL